MGSGQVGKVYYLYLLKDPDTRRVRYIGVSSDPKRRLNQHLKRARELRPDKMGPRDRWIYQLLKKDKEPEMVVALSGSPEKIARLEKQMIGSNKYPDLTNVGKGGEGIPSGSSVSFWDDISFILSERLGFSWLFFRTVEKVLYGR